MKHDTTLTTKTLKWDSPHKPQQTIQGPITVYGALSEHTETLTHESGSEGPNYGVGHRAQPENPRTLSVRGPTANAVEASDSGEKGARQGGG
jgi:hypothetical protein